MFETARPRAVASCALLLGLVALSACDSEDPPPAPDPGFVYAALGDSFSAAPGLPKVIDQDCKRSDHNYAHLVAQELPDGTFTDVTCGGATSENVLQSQQQAAAIQPPQIQAVTGDTDLVTFGFGANDAGFVTAAALECTVLAQSDPDGDPCRKANENKIPRIVAKVRENLEYALRAVARQAPDARIVVIGYPILFEGKQGCPKVFPVAKGDVTFVQGAYDQLNESVAAAAQGAGADFVDVAAASQGHGVCSKDPWINGQQEDEETGAAEYHPEPPMQQGIARLVLDLI